MIQLLDRPTVRTIFERDEPIVLLSVPRAHPMFSSRKRAYPVIGGGAVTVSGLYIVNWKKQSDGSDLVIDWVNDAFKQALFTNSITPNFSTDTGYASAPYTTNEVSGTGYTAAGVALASKTETESPTGTLMFDCNDPTWTSSTFSSVRCGVGHDTTLGSPSDPVIYLVNYGADYAVTSGTLIDQVAATGRFTFDITP